jgi:hexosaminidase
VASLFLFALPARAQQILPLPREISATSAPYVLPATIAISTSLEARDLEPIARQILHEHRVGATIHLTVGSHDSALGDEGYHLRVGPNGVAIEASGGAGLFYGLQTLDEILPFGKVGTEVAGVDIRDWPAYRWRGIHLDVSRHFFPVSVVERYIDVASHFKLNVFHWHLTDDQGWRIQILRYPRLTSVGGCRAGSEMNGDATTIDSKRYCGFYTQAQIRAVVAYAKAHFMTVVPEIEMPGHSQAALAAYPQLACTSGPFAVRETWGVSTQIYCPTEYSFTFLENVLREVMALFPGRYVHIGGDEVPKDAWQDSAAVHALMRAEHIATYDGVQGYFDRRIEQFLAANGRRAIGWDEMMDGKVSRNAAIMAWQGEARGRLAVQRGYDTVMTPDGPLYFDAYQGDPNDEPQAIGSLSTPQMVYEFEPTPSSLTPAQTQHVVGVQGNLWSEYIDTAPYLYYMLLPRMLSLAEIAWSDPHPRTWPGFETRLGAQVPWLSEHGYNFRIPNPEFTVSGATLHFSNVTSSVRTVRAETGDSNATVTITTVVPGAVIHYTTDGSPVVPSSPVYTAPIPVPPAANQLYDVQALVVLPDETVSRPSELLLNLTPTVRNER